MMMAAITGRDRNQSEPFWATGLSRMTPAGQRLARGLWALIRRSPQLAPLLWPGSGWRTGSSEHQSGRALDLMVTANTGSTPSAAERAAALALIAWLQANHRTIGIQWIIFSRDGKPRSESWNPDRGTWNSLGDRGGVSANHVDHLHIYLKSGGAGWAVGLDSAVVGSGSVPAPTPPASSVWDGVSFPGRDAFALGSRHPAVVVLGQRLVAHGWTGYKVGPGVPMSATDVAATAWFQARQGWSGADADGYPGPETWRRLMAAPTSTPKPTPPSKPVVSLSRLVAAAKTDPAKSGTPVSYAGVHTVEDALVREDLLDARLADGHFGTATIAAYSSWQRWLGYSGRDADGIPGRASLAKLAARRGFTITD